MNDWEIVVAGQREDFIEDLSRTGFEVLDSRTAAGEVSVNGRLVFVEIRVPDGYPYEPPKVTTTDRSGGASWHAEPGGGLCLWDAKESGHLPWRSAAQVVERVQEWFQNDAGGWLGDAPVLDLETYWPPASGFVVYPDLDSHEGHVLHVVKEGQVFRVREKGPVGTQRGCLVLDAGALSQPLRDPDAIVDLIGRCDEAARKAFRSGKAEILLVRYVRGGAYGVLALRVTNRKTPSFASMLSAHAGRSTLQLRAGSDAEHLGTVAVAVVGVGAIGSQVAELLTRAGVGHLKLVDSDVVRPGNLIRHTATDGDVGISKVEAVQRRCMATPASPLVATEWKAITTPLDAVGLFEAHDLVVDATADQRTTSLLLDAADALQRPLISVCLVRQGQVSRVDRAPLGDDEAHAEPLPEPKPDRNGLLFESGCGSPVSPAPMWAATFAASRAVGAALDLLTGRCEYPATVIDVLVAGDGAAGAIDGTP